MKIHGTASQAQCRLIVSPLARGAGQARERTMAETEFDIIMDDCRSALRRLDDPLNEAELTVACHAAADQLRAIAAMPARSAEALRLKAEAIQRARPHFDHDGLMLPRLIDSLVDD